MISVCGRHRRKQADLKRQNAHATQGMKTKHLIILTLAPWPACSTAYWARPKPHRSWGCSRSGKGRRRARLGVGTCSGTEQVRGRVEPSYAFGVRPRRRKRGLRYVNGRAGVNHAANRAAAFVGALLAGLIGLAGCRGGIAVANDGPMQGIGRSDAGGPGCTDRRENLRQHRNQDDWKKFSKPPAHETTPLHSPTNHPESQEFEIRFPKMRPRAPFWTHNRWDRKKCNPGWQGTIHFADCSNFEQSLLKMVTSRKRSVTSAGSGQPQG